MREEAEITITRQSSNYKQNQMKTDNQKKCSLRARNEIKKQTKLITGIK